MSKFFSFEDVLSVRPRELNIPVESNKDINYSRSIQLTNKTDVLVSYQISLARNFYLVSPEDIYLGTILPQSTCSVTVNGLKETRVSYIYMSASLAKDVNVTKLLQLTSDIMEHCLDRKTFLALLPVYYTHAAAANSCSALPEENEKGSLLDHNSNNNAKTAAAAESIASYSPSPGMYDFNIDDVLTVHPTELNIQFESKKKKNSRSIQLTNKTKELVAYRITSLSRDGYLVSPKDTYVGTILPQSTCFVIVKGLKKTRISYVHITAFLVKDGVKAEEITNKKFMKNFRASGFILLHVYYTRVAAAANSPSAVPEENEKGSLLVHNNNDLLHLSINDEVHGSTSKGKGLESSVRRESSIEMSSIVLFSDQEIKGAMSSKIGQGGYGAVYRGSLHDTEVAIKMLDPNSQQGINEFLQEMEVLGRMRHPNLVKLIGACVKLRALVYEFLPHGSLGDCLQKNPEILTWQMRTRIVYEICSALTFLHSIKPQPVVHGDLKPANILLDANFISKLADFGLCRFMPEGTTNVAFLATTPKGTFGYVDPEFRRTGILTADCDLYSFGVTILKILTRIDATGISERVRSAYKEKSLMIMVDPTAGQWPVDVSELLAYFGLKCCAKRKSPTLMNEIAEGLEKILAEIGR